MSAAQLDLPSKRGRTKSWCSSRAQPARRRCGRLETGHIPKATAGKQEPPPAYSFGFARRVQTVRRRSLRVPAPPCAGAECQPSRQCNSAVTTPRASREQSKGGVARWAYQNAVSRAAVDSSWSDPNGRSAVARQATLKRCREPSKWEAVLAQTHRLAFVTQRRSLLRFRAPPRP